MEVFAKYFRRLLLGNSPQIFPGINRNVENPGNYQLLVQEMEKITQDPLQASKIAEIIDTSEGDIYRDFDLGTFMEHFKLDPLAKTLLASAFLHVSKTDLNTKGALHKCSTELPSLTITSWGDSVADVRPTCANHRKSSGCRCRCSSFLTCNMCLQIPDRSTSSIPVSSRQKYRS